MLLLLKLTLAPLLVAMATLATRRWGPNVGGILIGLPLSTAPIFLFLAIDQGLDFAERATIGILLGLVGLVAFAMIYVITSRRAPWFVSLLFAAVAFFVFSAGVGGLQAGALEIALTAYAGLLLVALLIPRSRFRGRQSTVAMVGHLVPNDRRRRSYLGNHRSSPTAWSRLKRHRRYLSGRYHRGDHLYSPPIGPRGRQHHAARKRAVVALVRELFPGHRTDTEIPRHCGIDGPRRARGAGNDNRRIMG